MASGETIERTTVRHKKKQRKISNCVRLRERGNSDSKKGTINVSARVDGNSVASGVSQTRVVCRGG